MNREKDDYDLPHIKVIFIRGKNFLKRTLLKDIFFSIRKTDMRKYM